MSQKQGDIFKGVQSSAKHGTPHTLNKQTNSNNHQNHSNGSITPAIKPPTYAYNVQQHQSRPLNTVTHSNVFKPVKPKAKRRKIRLIIPRKRKLKDIQSKAKNANTANNVHGNNAKNTLQIPPKKKQKMNGTISSTTQTIQASPNTNSLFTSNSMMQVLLPQFPAHIPIHKTVQCENELPTPTHSPLHNPNSNSNSSQSHSATPPLAIATTNSSNSMDMPSMEIDNDTTQNTSENTQSQTVIPIPEAQTNTNVSQIHITSIQPSIDPNQPKFIPLPPPPPMESISPPPPMPKHTPVTTTNPYLDLQSQLHTSFQWPTHNSEGMAYTHPCPQCGQGFMSDTALTQHSLSHRKAKQRAIRERVHNTHKPSHNNQYYYPQKHVRKPKPSPIAHLNPRTQPILTPHTRVKPMESVSQSNGTKAKGKKKKRKYDSYNVRDANGEFPTHDINGQKYAFVCQSCGKGFPSGSALGGHRKVHNKRMRKRTGTHEYKVKKGKGDTNTSMDSIFYGDGPRSFSGNRNGKSKSYSNLMMAEGNKEIVNEYTGLNNVDIMHKIMDKLEALDSDKLFFECDTSVEYKQQISESLSFKIIRQRIRDHKYHNVQQDWLAEVNKLLRCVFKVYKSSDARCKAALKLKQFAYRQTMIAMAPKLQLKKSITQCGNGNGNVSNTQRRAVTRSRTKASNSSQSLLSVHSEPMSETAQYRLQCLAMDGYEKIEDYQYFCDDKVLSEKMSCKKSIVCDGKCCDTYDKLGPYLIGQERWESACACRKGLMECTDDCKCDPNVCKNRNIKTHTYKQLGTHVREQECFGLDQHTRMMIAKALPNQIKTFWNCDMTPCNGKDGKSYFIEDLLCPSINNYLFFVEQKGEYRTKYDPRMMVKHTEHEAKFMLSDVLRTMLFTAEHDRKDPNLCRVISYLLRLILNMGTDQLTNELCGIERSKRRIGFEDSNNGNCEYFLDAYLRTDLDVSGEDIICHEYFPIYTKGTGVICIDKGGIPKNEYVISFLGVVYSPWCWYEKDDRTRWLVKSKGAQKQPEFFNICMEKHKDDGDGYDLVFIDPSHKGNYGSRLSHSCAPNCISVSMGVRGKYNIAVYASADIRYGEELCFNYNSVTENEEEWREAVCLCGTSECNGQFLIYAGTQLYTEVLRKSQNILHRTANLFNCDKPTSAESEYESILERYNLKHNGALHGIPQWMRRYAALVCKYIDFEQSELPKELQSKAMNNEKGYGAFCKLENAIEECKGLKFVRLSNLVISLNKMNLFFRHPPNRNLMHLGLFKCYDCRDLTNKLWFSEKSIISDLYLYISIYEGYQHSILKKINEIRHILQSCTEIEVMKQYLLQIREELLRIPPRAGAYHHAAADILLMYASTKYFFYFHPPYQGFQSRVFSYNELGYQKPQNCANYSMPPPKKYSTQYVWGQLNYWERHTIESPDQSLSAERRGCVTLPNMKCCYVKPAPGKVCKHRRLYDYQMRKTVIKHLKTQSHKAWPIKWHFGFKNGSLYGSPWLDAYIDPDHEQSKFEKFIQTMRDTKVIYPDGTYCVIESDDLEESVGSVSVKEECKTNSTNPNRIINNNANGKEEMDCDDDDKKEEEKSVETKPMRRSNRLRGKTPKRSYVDT